MDEKHLSEAGETFDKTGETITARPYQGMDDFMRIRAFLMNTYRLNRCFHNWPIRRLEGSRFWGDPDWGQEWEKQVQLWENEAGKLVGVAHREDGQGDICLEVHPYYRHIEDQMMDWAEVHLAASDEDGRPHTWLDVYDYDTRRQDMLTRRGYQKTQGYGYQRWRETWEIPEIKAPEGYIIRSLRPGSMEDCARWAEVVSAVFAHANATAQHIATFQTSPSYRHDLHLVAEAEDGSFAAFAGITLDTMNRVAEFEPVGTHPDHRQKGLGKAVMTEGLWRLERLGADKAYVFTGSAVPANALYESMGFTSYHMNHTWKKML
jgi:mycothiol synthase